MHCAHVSTPFDFSFGGNIYHDTIFSRQDIIIKNYLVYVAVYEPSLPCYPSLTLAQITLQISQLCPIFQWAICERVTPSVTVTAELSWLHNGKITPALHRPGAQQCYDNCPHCARIVDCMHKSNCSGFKCGVLSSNFAEIRGPAAAVLQNQELNVKSSPGQQQQPRIPGTGWSGEIFCENSILRLSRKFRL